MYEQHPAALESPRALYRSPETAPTVLTCHVSTPADPWHCLLSAAVWLVLSLALAGRGPHGVEGVSWWAGHAGAAQPAARAVKNG